MPRRNSLLLVSLTALIYFAASPVAQADVACAVAELSNTIDSYSINQLGGLRSAQALANLEPGPVVVSPSNRFAYTLSGVNGSRSIGGWKIGLNCSLSLIASSPFASTGARSMAFTPNSKFAYAVDDFSSENVEQFAVNPSTGALTSIGTAFSGLQPSEIAVTLKGTFAVVTNSGGNSISVFGINPTSGALTSVAGSPFAATGNPQSVVVSPNQKFVLTANFGINFAGSIGTYAMSRTTGALTHQATALFPLNCGFHGGRAKLAGNFLYVATGGGDGVAAFSFNQTNGTVAPIACYPAGSMPYGLAFNPYTSSLYVANIGSSLGNEPPLFRFSSNSATGALTLDNTYGVDGVPGYGVGLADGAIVKYTPTDAYVSNFGSDSIAEFSIVNDGLASVPGSPLKVSNHPKASVATPNGKLLFTGNGDGTILGFHIEGTGALKQIKNGFPITGLTNPIALEIDPVHNYLYAVDPATSTTSAYTINNTTGKLNFLALGTTGGTGPQALAIDPTGIFFVVANTGSNNVGIGITGSGIVSSVATGNAPKGIVIDPSDQFVYVTNSGDNTVSPFFFSLASPYLTPISAAVAAGTGPSAVVAEPYGKYLYVANSGSDTISAYSINPLTGAITPIGAFSTSSVPSALSVSNDGKLLFVTLNGAPGALTVFTINSDGTLTSFIQGVLGTTATSITLIGNSK